MDNKERTNSISSSDNSNKNEKTVALKQNKTTNATSMQTKFDDFIHLLALLI